MSEPERPGSGRNVMIPREPIVACVFDLDGTIIDSEPLYLESDRAFLAARGMAFHDELNTRMKGSGAADFFAILAAEFPGNPFNRLQLEEKIRLKDDDYLSHCRGRLRVFGPVVRLLDALAARGIALAIASGSTPRVIDGTLVLAGLRDRFRIVVSASEVGSGKPAPDVFLEAARRLRLDPAACLAFEDSKAGVRSAVAAGMACVALPDPAEGEPHADFFLADLVVQGGPAALDPGAILAAFFSR
ncbi:MAG: HAD family phosphatase [Spirochaetes bacterium]|nr:HAD family phosphatase [Spirochaetota bacterium]